MGDVIPLVPPIPMDGLARALDEITDATTEAVVLIAVSADRISVRRFGRPDLCDDGLRAAVETETP